ncbi:MAG: hypothetical protein ABUT11_00290 [Leifsonia sp.]
MSDTPTQRLDTPDDAGRNGDAAQRRSSRGLLIGLIAVGAAILIAIIILLIVLLGGSGTPIATGTTSPIASDTPTTSSTPSATPTPVVTQTTPAPTPSKTSGGGGGGSQPTGAAFTTFSPVKQVHCEAPAPNFTPPPIAIQVKWATVRTNSVWIVFGDSDAADSGFMQLPVSGNQSNFPYELDYPCGQHSIEVTMTLVGSDGHHVQKHWTITNTGDQF